MSNTSDFNKPQTSDNYASVLSEIAANNADLAMGLDPAITNPANVPTGAKRWNSANSYWEIFSGTAWGVLASIYNIVAAQAVKLQNARNIKLTGDVTGSATFDGSADASIAATLPTVNANVGTFGSSTVIPVVTVNAKGLITAITTAILSIPTKLSQLTNDAGFITNVVTALGYTPYNASNPAGYVTPSGSVAYATNAGSAANGGVTSVNGQTGSVVIGSAINGRAFTSNGTFTIPTGVTALKVTVQGGGAGGGGSSSGGGGGGASIAYLTGLTPGNTIAVTVGGESGTSKITSGTQAITTIQATGGSGQSGGSGSGGSINFTGGTGGFCGNCGSAAGGSSLLGFGGSQNNPGNSGGFSGSGYGGGGGSGAGSYGTGSSGAPGIVIFEW
jgi:hypothetical protein